MRPGIFTWSFVLIFSSHAPAQQDSLILRLMRQSKITGLGIGIIEKNKPVSVRTYGYRNREKNLSNDTATCFYAASLSKAVFAWLVMQLVDEGRINLDTPLARYFTKPLPEYANYKDLQGDDRWKKITARHCLSHTTGFPNWRFFNSHDNNRLEIFFEPGSRYAYSGEGIFLLQIAIENITGKELEELAREKIFRPLEMNRTSYTWQPSYENNFAYGYDEKEDSIPKKRRWKQQLRITRGLWPQRTRAGVSRQKHSGKC
jgi:CubicO group peptidase (beta-lactamase class C family)